MLEEDLLLLLASADNFGNGTFPFSFALDTI